MINKVIRVSALIGLVCLFLASGTIAGDLRAPGMEIFKALYGYPEGNESNSAKAVMKINSSKHLLKEYVEYQWKNDNWNEYLKIMNIFNHLDTIATTTVQFWLDAINDWQNASCQNNQYDQDGRLSRIVWQQWSGSMWQVFLYTDITYYEDGKMKQARSYFSGEEILESFSYDENGYLALYLYQVRDDEYSDPENVRQVLHEFSPEGRRLGYIVQTWKSEEWSNDEKAEFKYLPDGRAELRLTEIMYYEWMAEDWQTVKRTTYNYDVDNVLVSTLDEDFVGTGWQQTINRFYTYNAFGMISEELHKKYSVMDGWENYVRISRAYQQFTTDVVMLEDNLPGDFSVAQNYPNPFNLSTIIEFSLPERSPVTVTIYNLLGQKIRTLLDEYLAAGRYKIDWDGLDHTGQVVSTGVYFYKISAQECSITRKMVLIK